MSAYAFDSSLLGFDSGSKSSRGGADLFDAGVQTVFWRAARKGFGFPRVVTTAVAPFVDTDSAAILTFSTEDCYSSSLALKAEAGRAFSERFGQYAAERLNMLFSCRAGWDGGRAKALQLSSVRTALNFIAKHDIRGFEVGVFMSLDGQLILNWPVSSGIFEATFGDGFVSIFVDGMEDGETYCLSDGALKEVVQELG